MLLLRKLAEAVRDGTLPSFLAAERVSMEWVEKVRGANGFQVFLRNV